jgi:cytochrome c biogenesis protein CcdA
MQELAANIKEWLDPWMLEICMAFMATVLTLYDDDITIVFKKRLKNHPFLVRVSVFVVLCAFVYGFLTVVGAKAMATVFSKAVPPIYWIPLIVAAFFVVGLLAERKKQI